MPKNCENPEFMAKWKANEGRFKDPEKAREAQRKSAESRRRNSEARKQVRDILTNPDGFREEALAAILEDYPNAMNDLAKSMFRDALDGDKASRELMSKMFGIEAPKKTEVKVVDETSPEEAADILRKMMNNPSNDD